MAENPYWHSYPANPRIEQRRLQARRLWASWSILVRAVLCLIPGYTSFAAYGGLRLLNTTFGPSSAAIGIALAGTLFFHLLLIGIAAQLIRVSRSMVSTLLICILAGCLAAEFWIAADEHSFWCEIRDQPPPPGVVRLRDRWPPFDEYAMGYEQNRGFWTND